MHPLFEVPRRRPSSLSGPFNDYDRESLREILEKPDGELRRYEFVVLLGPHLPAGTYEETVYFLPLAFSYLLENDADALEMVSAVFGYSAINADRLQSDGVGEAVRDSIRRCLGHWTSKFRVHHYDLEACKRKGWQLRYDDCVANAEVVGQAVGDLVEFKTLSGLASGFLRQLADSTEPVQRAWFVELVRNKLQPLGVYVVPDAPDLLKILFNEEFIRRALRSCRRAMVRSEASPTYWRDTLMTVESFLARLDCGS